MESLKAKGLDLFAAYGNTGTDARAYAAAGIPKVYLSSANIQRLSGNASAPLCHFE
jgi:hypothetical protein